MPPAISRTVSGYYIDEKRGEKEARANNMKFVNFGSEWKKVWADFKASEPASVVAGAKGRVAKNAEAIVRANLKQWGRAATATPPFFPACS